MKSTSTTVVEAPATGLETAHTTTDAAINLKVETASIKPTMQKAFPSRATTSPTTTTASL